MFQAKVFQRAWISISFIGAFTAVLAAHLASASSSFEIVQSFPIETTLQVPGVAQTQQVWLDIVNSAQHTLDIEQYYISNGDSLQPVIAAITSAAARGVKVRFILDSAFLKSNPTEADCVKNVQNIDLRQIDFSPGIMHSKYIVADGVNAYTGSANMDWLALSHIHEMGLHTVDTTIGSQLELIFNHDWPNATEMVSTQPLKNSSLKLSIRTFLKKVLKHFQADGLPEINVVASPTQANPQGISGTLDTLVSLMNGAKTSLDIQVYQYSTAPYSGKGPAWTPLDIAVRAAAARGVDVRLLVDATVMPRGSKAELQALALLPHVQVKTVTIPQWSGGPLKYARLIHSKYFVIDGGTSSWIGSENWIDSYFLDTRNVGVTIQDMTAGAQVEQIYQSVWNSAYASAITE